MSNLISVHPPDMRWWDSHKKITLNTNNIEDKFDIPDLNLRDICLLDLPHVSVQRDTKGRSKKQSKHFAKDRLPLGEFTLAYVLKDFDNENGTWSKKGELAVINGNTRIYNQRIGLNNITVPITLQVFGVKSLKEMRDIYHCYDNAAATENKKDILYGVCNHLGLSFVNGMKKYLWNTELNQVYPFDSADDKMVKVSYFLHVLEDLDETGIYDPGVKELNKAQVRGACLLFLQYHYGTKRYEQAKRIVKSLAQTTKLGANSAKYNDESTQKKWSGLTHIIWTALGLNTHGDDYNKASKRMDWYNIKSQQEDRWVKPFSFILWMLSKQMLGETMEKIHLSSYYKGGDENEFENVREYLRLQAQNNRFFSQS